jgi:hypothetical protein
MKFKTNLKEVFGRAAFEKMALRKSKTCFIRVFKEAVYNYIDIQPQSKRPLGKPRRRCEHNIKMYLEEIGWGFGLDLCGSC